MPVDLDNISNVIENSLDLVRIRAIEAINPRRRMGALIHGTALFIERLRDWIMSLKGDHPIRKWSVVPHSVDNIATQASSSLPDGGHRQNGLDQRNMFAIPVFAQKINGAPSIPMFFVIIDLPQACRCRRLQVR